MDSHFLWLLPSVRIHVAGTELVIRRDERCVRIDGVGIAALEFLSQLDGSKTEGELEGSPLSGLVLPLLRQFGWLVTLSRPLRESVAERAWLSRQLSYWAHLTQEVPDRLVEALARKTALIIGMGGIGNHAAFALAGAGVGKLIITDPDTVEVSNLNRQFLYSSADVGRKKVDVAAERLRGSFPTSEVKTHCVDFDEIAADVSIPDADITLVCGELRLMFDQPRAVGTRAIVTAGYYGPVAAVGPLIWPEAGTACWSCALLPAAERNRGIPQITTSVANGWNPSAATINGLAGSILSEVALRALVPRGALPLLLLNERLEVDMRDLCTRRVKLTTVSCGCY